MSLHYDFSLATDLAPEAPQDVIDTIAYLVRTQDYHFDAVPDHDFFKTAGWESFFQFKPTDTYFPGDLYRTFRKAYRYTKNKVEHYRHSVSVRGYIIDDELDSFFQFVDWLAPHSASTGFIGYLREEFDWWPTLVFIKEGQVYVHEAKEIPTPINDGAREW